MDVRQARLIASKISSGKSHSAFSHQVVLCFRALYFCYEHAGVSYFEDFTFAINSN